MTLTAQHTARAGGSWCDIQGHLGFLYAQAQGRAVMAELGVRAGNSTCALLAAAETTGHGQLWSVDFAPPQVPAAWMQLPYWHFLQAGDLSEEARLFVPAELDLLLIDTSHDYGHTLEELAAYAPRVRPGSVILCHDTCWLPGDIESRLPIGPVSRALDSWSEQSGLGWDNRPGSYGMGVIEIPEEP